VTDRVHLFLPCPGGVEPWLLAEVQSLLPGRTVRERRGGVSVQGSLDDAMRLNLESRLASRVLIEVAQGPYRDEHDLYALARGVDWSVWLSPRQTLRVDVTAQRSPLTSLHFAALRIKDAVCDAMRDATGERPSVDTRRPDLGLVLHVDAAQAALYVDSSGEALFKRGWREDAGDAPLKETLAAAMLAAAGWRGTPEAGGALLDPCCGSGTIVIEAAQIACGIAPGLARTFAFERLAPFATADRRQHWQAMRSAARARVHASAVPIFASDVSFRMLDFARRNAERAGVAQAIEFHGGDALQRPAPPLPAGLPATLMLNPPYGARIAPKGTRATPAVAQGNVHPAPGRHSRQEPGPDNRSLAPDFFARLAAHWKRAFTTHPAGWTAWVLSPDMKLPTVMRLQASRRVPLWNGPIECRLYRFELVAGRLRPTDDSPPVMRDGAPAPATAAPAPADPPARAKRRS
jgi:putative N6-adenine-specific DNA methylase